MTTQEWRLPTVDEAIEAHMAAHAHRPGYPAMHKLYPSSLQNSTMVECHYCGVVTECEREPQSERF